MNALLERLKTALDGQRKFIADAAHQLRTPLTAVKLHAEQAASAKDPAKVLEAVKELRASADRAVRLSNQLLSLARAEPGEQAARFTDFDYAALAFETGAEWVPRALAAHVDMGFQRLDDPDNEHPLIVRGNLVLVREVIGNLIDNALKYVPTSRLEGARVTVTVTQTIDENGRKMGEIVVEDNGPGVPQEQQQDLFKRFFRGDGHGVEGGAGLGLAIVHDIMVLHNGNVHYEDAPAPEGGARFIVRMPLKPA